MYYKLLHRGRFSLCGAERLRRWPPLGVWTEPITAPSIGNRGWHACKLRNVLEGSGGFLYQVEIDGPRHEWRGYIAASRARLVRRIGKWDIETLSAWAASLADRVRACRDAGMIEANVFCLKHLDRLVEQAASAESAEECLPYVRQAHAMALHMLGRDSDAMYVSEETRAMADLKRMLKL